ncbi:MAG TPA: hypothetical protein VL133_13355 [Devosia sp.]|nr:hypothetical protein [Devosia sp.]
MSALRALILAMLVLLVAPALAQDWGQYDNVRFGYSIAIPPDFVGQGESDNGDGQQFQRRRGAQNLTVWGGLLGTANVDFESEVKWRMARATAAGWNLTYQATTPEWASFSAIKGSRVLYQGMVLLCDRNHYAAFRAEYFTRDAAEMAAVIETLVGSLRSAAC